LLLLLLLPPLALLRAGSRLCTNAQQRCCYQLPHLQQCAEQHTERRCSELVS
jgi:hypothetical protein